MELITKTLDEKRITSKHPTKYLEVIIDNRLTFNNHLSYTAKKYEPTANSLTWLMPNFQNRKKKSLD